MWGGLHPSLTRALGGAGAQAPGGNGWSPGAGKGADPRAKLSFGGRRASARGPDLRCPFIWWQLSPRGGEDVGRPPRVGPQAPGRPGESEPQLAAGWVDEAELAFLELSRRFSCCVSVLTRSQTPRPAPARPATHRPVPVARLSSRGAPSSLPPAMCLHREPGCSPLVGMPGDLCVGLGDAENTLGDKCAASCL